MKTQLFTNPTKIVCLSLLFLFVAFNATMSNAQQLSNTPFLFQENKNQHPSQVKYSVGIGEGTQLFMEKNKFTFVKYDPQQLEKIHEDSHEKKTKKSGLVNFHAFEMNFIGSNSNVNITANDKSTSYSNFFRGNDPAHWASEVYSYKEVTYTNIYAGIDLHAYNQEQNFKYDFIVTPGTDPSIIKMQFSGTDHLFLDSNRLFIQTSVGDIIQNTPFTYQIINGVQQEVKCNYILSSTDNMVSFEFPEGYNSQYALIIDPILVAATFSGAPYGCTTYGHCATYDEAGNIYTGGECFEPGYPTTSGAFQTSFAGWVDIAISKLSPNGSALIWATYIGGTGDDVPNSLFVNPSQEIYILGATTSNNYPTSAGCYDNLYNGDDDIVVTHLNNSGTAMVGSTYIGGSNDDGGGIVPWEMHYHDGMRGEIIVDASNNAWIASFTSSTNFPTTAGTYDNSKSGTWDACVFRLSPNLSTLQWSSFLGGNSSDGAYGLRLNLAGELYITGATMSTNLPSTSGFYDPSYNGMSDGFIARFNPSGNALLSCTYLGTWDMDISYFIDLDVDQNVYVYGISDGSMPITAGVYNNTGSHNFISKFNPTLTSLVFSTVFGSNGSDPIEPSAFMVDQCKNIYISGFGAGNYYPTTADALYPNSSSAGGGNCYFMVLSQNAASLLYGSYYYGWHVDGGTSRFDPNGIIYQGICIGSGGASTTPGAYADNTNAPSWDMYAVKIDFEKQGVVAHAHTEPSTSGCAPFVVDFVNTSINAVNYFWDFGDAGATSNAFEPSHTFNNPGIYQVMLIARDPSSCNVADTTYLTITVNSSANVLANFTYQQSPNCDISLVDFNNQSENGIIFHWDFGDGITSTEIDPTHTYAHPGNYMVTLIVNDTVCGQNDQIQLPITLQDAFVIFIPDGEICAGQPATLDAGIVADSYLWSTGETSQTIMVTSPGSYSVEVTKGNCFKSETVELTELVFDPSPDTMRVCPNATLFHAGNGTEFLWSTGETTEAITISDTLTIWYQKMVGYCLVSDTIVVRYNARPTGLFIPNSFTPNEDGLNEIYYLVGADEVEFEFMVFNRWGDKIFYSNSPAKGWDGKNDNGKLVEQGVYAWKLIYKSYCIAPTQILLGHVNVIR